MVLIECKKSALRNYTGLEDFTAMQVHTTLLGRNLSSCPRKKTMLEDGHCTNSLVHDHECLSEIAGPDTRRHTMKLSGKRIQLKRAAKSSCIAELLSAYLFMCDSVMLKTMVTHNLQQ